MTLPLEGIRVADFSWVIAGPFCTRTLGLLGAEVIRIESGMHTDLNRRVGPFADGIEGLERSGLWHALNVNKKSVTLNLNEPRGQELALQIIRDCDVVIENFASGQMEKFNLGYDRLKRERPNIVYVTSSGLGRSGPYSGYVTYGPPLTAYAGLASVTGQDGGPPERWIGGLWTDYQAGMTSLFGLLAALEHRERTGEGQQVEYSMSEAISAQLPEAFIEWGCTGSAPGPRGNSDPGMCPHGIYPAAGRDRWVAIAVQNDDDWLKLREIDDGFGGWDRPEFDAVEGRLAHRKVIEERLSSWTRARPAEETAQLLQERGVSAGAVASVPELLQDERLIARGFFLRHHHPVVGTRQLAGVPWRLPAMSGAPVSHAPLLGEHNWGIFVEQLGMDPRIFSELVTDGVIQ